MADFAAAMTPRLVDFAQRHDWLGRRIVDLGCGTGAGLRWLAQRNYVAAGVDSAPAMLALTRAALSAGGSDGRNLNADLRQQDIRELGPDLAGTDLALALDVLNELNSLRDLEAVFRSVHTILNPGKLFIFDLHTLQGLAQMGLEGMTLLRDLPDLTVFTSSDYDHERQVNERRYLVFQRAGDAWTRAEATRALRAFPAQAVATLLQRCGFQANHVLDLNFDSFEPGVSRAARIIFVAEKH
jgi:SAM-dependent methyltransferase